MKFKNFFKEIPEPFTIHADFESLTLLVETAQTASVENNAISYTENNQQHNICSYVLKLLSNYDCIIEDYIIGDDRTKDADTY